MRLLSVYVPVRACEDLSGHEVFGRGLYVSIQSGRLHGLRRRRLVLGLFVSLTAHDPCPYYSVFVADVQPSVCCHL